MTVRPPAEKEQLLFDHCTREQWRDYVLRRFIIVRTKTYEYRVTPVGLTGPYGVGVGVFVHTNHRRVLEADAVLTLKLWLEADERRVRRLSCCSLGRVRTDKALAPVRASFHAPREAASRFIRVLL